MAEGFENLKIEISKLLAWVEDREDQGSRSFCLQRFLTHDRHVSKISMVCLYLGQIRPGNALNSKVGGLEFSDRLLDHASLSFRGFVFFSSRVPLRYLPTVLNGPPMKKEWRG